MAEPVLVPYAVRERRLLRQPEHARPDLARLIDGRVTFTARPRWGIF